jgi:CIC family chloride channel protein
MQSQVAILKPLSSAIWKPSEHRGPIMMTGGAFGSIIAQLFHMTSSNVRRSWWPAQLRGMSTTFGTPIATVLLAIELLL